MKTISTRALDAINSNWRIETKYRINALQYLALKNAVIPFLRPDPFTLKAPIKKYIVRSLYFDTWDYKLYTEKIGGVCDRMKFRIRTYGMDPAEKPDIRIEIKVRKGVSMEKFSTLINHQEHKNFTRFRKWSFDDDPVIMEFLRYVYKWNLHPTTLVQYLREGFQSIEQEDLRITFDHQIKSTSAKELFPNNIIWHRHHLSQIVLEIKHKNEIPLWLNEIIQYFSLKVISNSKYTNAIEFSKRNHIDNSVYFL
jgi:hypothetical protein